MSNYNRVSTNPQHHRTGQYNSYYNGKNTSSYGQCDSGISDLFDNTPTEAQSEGPESYSHHFPKLILQGNHEDVENGDSGIMMGEDDTCKDSARSSRNSQPESLVPMDVDSTSSDSNRARSSSPKFMSDSETSKLILPTNQECRLNSRSKRAPRIPKKTVPARISVTNEPAVITRTVRSSVTPNAQSSTTKFDFSNTTAWQSRHQQPSSLPAFTSSVSTNVLTCNTYSLNATNTTNQRVPPILSAQHLGQYINFFIPDKEGDTGFHLAVIHSQPDLLDCLLYIMSKNKNLQPVVNEQNGLYQTALHLATHTQQLEIMRKLLIAGASINMTDHKGNTPLHIAAKFSSTRLLEEIARFVSLKTILEVAQIRNNEGQSCVHVAAKNGNTELLGKMKSLGINVNMQDFNCGKTPLHLVAEESSLANVQFLIETCEADVNCVTYSGCSALHIAAGRGDIAVVAYLVSMGANPELLTDEGDLPLDLSGSEQVTAFLTRVASLKWLY